MKKRKPIAVITILLLICAAALVPTCKMDVDEAARNISLTDPYISKQPASYAYYVGEAPASELSIEVADWKKDEGALSYQWYTFDTIDDYVKSGGTAIQGATGTTYAPTLKTAAGDKNYYYVVVTNTNSKVNVGAKTGSVQSEVAIISFTAAETALPPVISRNPGSAGYLAGRNLNPLNVRTAARADRAAAPRNALLSYQWYRLPIVDGVVAAIADGEEIPNATSVSYQPDPASLQFGKNYFYVQVTSTETTYGDAVETSVPAIIEILPGVRAIAPNIITQPRDKMYKLGETPEPLRVLGRSRDSGAISYQWYKNSHPYISTATATLTTAEPVGGATNAEFTPQINTSAAAEEYYYVVVTNTNTNVTTTETTATTTSKVVKVSAAAFDTLTANATVTVANPKDPTKRYQYVRGYGGMDVAWANFPRTYPEEMELMYNPDTGLGYNINRIMISPGKVDPIEGVQDLVNAHRPDYYENVKIVNKYGGYNLASPWSPPKEWKSNNSINGGGNLMPAYYRQYADYLRRFAQNMYDKGAPIYAISISNEPNYTAGYDGCEWTAVEMRDFYKQVGRFTNGVRGYGGGKYISTVLTVNGESANTPIINKEALMDPVSRSAIDLLCRHVYGEQTTTLWRIDRNGNNIPFNAATDTNTTNILSRNDGTKYEVWMTEHNLNSANATAYPNDSTWPYVWRFMNDIDLVMRLNNENAFVWWASKRFYSMLGDNSYGTRDGQVLPRGYGLSHYAKYTNDTHRIVADVSGTLVGGAQITNETNSSNVNGRTFSLDNESARITAYASITSGKENAPIIDSADDVEFISLVMWTPTSTSGSGGVDMGTVKIQMPAGFEIGSYTAIKSTAPVGTTPHYHEAYTVTIDPDRNAAYVTLNNSQMLSVKFIKQ